MLIWSNFTLVFVYFGFWMFCEYTIYSLVYKFYFSHYFIGMGFDCLYAKYGYIRVLDLGFVYCDLL